MLNTRPATFVRLTCGDHDIVPAVVEAGEQIECPDGHGWVQAAEVIPTGIVDTITITR